MPSMAPSCRRASFFGHVQMKGIRVGSRQTAAQTSARSSLAFVESLPSADKLGHCSVGSLAASQAPLHRGLTCSRAKAIYAHLTMGFSGASPSFFRKSSGLSLYYVVQCYAAILKIGQRRYATRLGTWAIVAASSSFPEFYARARLRGS